MIQHKFSYLPTENHCTLTKFLIIAMPSNPDIVFVGGTSYDFDKILPIPDADIGGIRVSDPERSGQI